MSEKITESEVKDFVDSIFAEFAERKANYYNSLEGDLEDVYAECYNKKSINYNEWLEQPAKIVHCGNELHYIDDVARAVIFYYDLRKEVYNYLLDQKEKCSVVNAATRLIADAIVGCDCFYHSSKEDMVETALEKNGYYFDWD